MVALVFESPVSLRRASIRSDLFMVGLLRTAVTQSYIPDCLEIVKRY